MKAKILQRIRLRHRLFLAFFIVIGLSQALVLTYAAFSSVNDIDNPAQLVSRRYAIEFAPVFSFSYRANEDWGQAELLIDEMMKNSSREMLNDNDESFFEVINMPQPFRINRIILLDASGEIVVDSQRDPASAEALFPNAVPLLDEDGSQIGSLIIGSGFNADFILEIQQGSRQAFIGISLWATVISIILSLILSYRLSQPLRKLRQAAATLADSGEVEELPITRYDEIGELTAIFNEMSGRIQHQRHLRQQMVADIAHELRTPLSVMKIELSSLVDGLQDPANVTVSLQQEIDTLEKLIGDLNLLALADAQELKLDLREIDAADFLTQATRQWEQPAHQHGMTINLILPHNHEILIQGDERRLYQVLSNLVNNAFKYAADNPKLEISLVEVNDKTIQFRVRDFGSGIPPEDIPYLFDRFYRVKGNQVLEAGGSGLGLAISKRLVDLHGGRIWCESKLGEGSQFVVELSQGQNRNENNLTA
ncbi:MAG: HAMP domain-containing sensor histidine kinase [Chloroflexota bacterium]